MLGVVFYSLSRGVGATVAAKDVVERGRYWASSNHK
ncbi:hypothetical protein SAMN05421878_102201 [Actinobaculum suis]|uniref:Uncharacterized protein n=1 Tax=Actinobaculum suis TaxID=1657 RepID=A0A1G7AFC6_9ACTO|nr:hypothetical protein SAMN05421878_102201 [Actinobaculum suis]